MLIKKLKQLIKKAVADPTFGRPKEIVAYDFISGRYFEIGDVESYHENELVLIMKPLDRS